MQGGKGFALKPDILDAFEIHSENNKVECRSRDIRTDISNKFYHVSNFARIHIVDKHEYRTLLVGRVGEQYLEILGVIVLIYSPELLVKTLGRLR